MFFRLPVQVRRAVAWLVTIVSVALLVQPDASAAEWAVRKEAEWPEWHLPAPRADQMEVGGVHLDLIGPRNEEATMLRLSRHASKRLPELAKELGVPIGSRIQVVLAGTQREFRDTQPGRVPGWADGTAWPTVGLIYLKRPGIRGGGQKPLEQVLDHELIHVLLGRAFLPYRPPQWLQEGVAQVFANEVGPENTERLARGMLNRDLHTLDELVSGFPADPQGAELAYAETADFVIWMMQEYGPETIPALIKHLAQGKPASAAIRESTGEFYREVERKWRSRLTSGVPLWGGPLSEDGLWIVAAFMLAVGGFRRRREIRSRIEEMGRDEAAIEGLVVALLEVEQQRQMTMPVVPPWWWMPEDEPEPVH